MTTFPSLGLPTPGQRVHNGLQTLNGIADRLRALRIRHAASVQQIRDAVSRDPNLTAEGRQNMLRERTTAAGESSLAELGALKDEMTRAQDAIDSAIAGSWPKPTPGVEGMLGRQAAWARARSLLEGAGLTVTGLIGETTDPETLFALREELPTWVRSHGGDANTVERVTQRIDLRVGKLITRDSQGEIDLLGKFQATAIVAQLGPLLDGAEVEFTGRTGYSNPLGSAVASQYARAAVEEAQQPIIKSDGTIL